MFFPFQIDALNVFSSKYATFGPLKGIESWQQIYAYRFWEKMFYGLLSFEWPIFLWNLVT